jgi:hypothetical protein
MAGTANSAVPLHWIGPTSGPKEAVTQETPDTRLPKIHGVLFESAPDDMIEGGRDGHILVLNAEKAFGHSREELRLWKLFGGSEHRD